MDLDITNIKGYTGFAAYRNPNNKNQIIWFMVYGGLLLLNGKYVNVTESWLKAQLANKYKGQSDTRPYDSKPRRGYQVNSAVVKESELREKREARWFEKKDGSIAKVNKTPSKPSAPSTSAGGGRPVVPAPPAGVREKEDTDECTPPTLENYIMACEKLVIPELGGKISLWAKNQETYLTNFNKANKCLNALMADLQALDYYKFKNRIERLRNYYTEFSTKSLLAKDPTQMR